jgi:hypothetical protein
MGKDVNKKFTVSLDISTEEAESQVMASAKKIKNMLNDAMKEGLGIKELRNMAKQINSLFTGVGKIAPIDIDKYFKGRGDTASRVKILTDALNDLSVAMLNVGNNTGSKYGFGGTGGNFSELSDDAKRQVDELEKQADRYQDVLNKFRSVRDMSLAYQDGNEIKLEFDATEKSAKELIDRYRELDDTLRQCEDGSIEYMNTLAERARVALQATELYNALERKNGSTPQVLYDFVYSDDSFVDAAIEDFEYEFDELLQSLTTKMQDVYNKISDIKNNALNTISGTSSQSIDDKLDDQIQQIGSVAEKAEDKVRSLHQAIKETFMQASQLEVDVANGRADGKESMYLFDDKGLSSVAQGVDYQVDTDSIVSQLVSSLKDMK